MWLSFLNSWKLGKTGKKNPEIQEAIREDCRSQHDMDSTDIDRVMQTLPFAQEEPFTGARPQKPLFWFYARKFEKR